MVADLHIHSRYSIATGREADLEHLDLWGRYKGVQVVGTGDCTHPEWLKELTAKLEAVAPGTYRLRPELALPLKLKGPAWEAEAPVHFLVTGEVSTVYQQGGRTRKVHLLLVLASLEAALKLSQRLSRLGNVTADGRPTLGLAAPLLMQAVLEADPEALVIPAHIWTPWFSVLGAKSGFDSLEECFGDLLPQVYALETGLSSDPRMNWRVSRLDRFLLVSNSDAHSPAKLGREANILRVPPTFAALARALRTQEGFAGTLEFFPQEGKYHLDGHRRCQLRLTPEESQALGGRCPRCGKPLTYGVMHRVLDLADRPPGEPAPGAKTFESLIPLTEVLGEVLQSQPGSRKVARQYFRLLESLGPELAILRRAPLKDLAREGGSLLALALDRMRRGEVHIAPGYDGVYGEIRLLSPEDRWQARGQEAFWSPPPPAPPGASLNESPDLPSKTIVSPFLAEPPVEASFAANRKPKTENRPGEDPLLAGLNPAQRAAVIHKGPPLLVQAGPGTGKTRALTHRLAYLLRRRGVPPEEILAVTFTRQAAAEMVSRLTRLLPDFPGLNRLTVKTFHALGHQLLLTQEAPRQVAEEEHRRALLRGVAKECGRPYGDLEKRIIAWKQALQYPEDLGPEAGPWKAAFKAYEAALAREGLWDYEDLIARSARLLSQQAEVRDRWRGRFRHVLVDEYQDLNEAQYRLFQALVGPEAEVMVIGDPHQAIYGFRGASPEYFHRFRQDWPEAVLLNFSETYRLPAPLLEAAQQVLAAGGVLPPPLVSRRPGNLKPVLLEAATPQAEALAIARTIEELVGGLSHLALEDSRLRDLEPEAQASFREVAVLYRFHAQGPELEKALTEAGLPCQRPREGVGPELEGLDLAAERVKLLTLHAAKGLEFPYVFIAGCEAGLLPWEPEGERPGDPAEEKRLFYVGLTRASRRVFLTRARARTLFGKRRRPQLSPLVRALGPELLTSGKASGAAPSRPRQPQLFPGLAPPRSRRAR